MQSQFLQKLKIPDKSGVYTFKQKGQILYIGKATSLRDRVKSYFGKDLIVTRGPHLVDMVTKSSTIDWQETDSVLEALILEAALIKKHQPYYNTKEKDDKSWNYVCISKELIPKVLVVRGKEINFEQQVASGQKLSAIYGPFTNGNQLREAMKIVRRIFPYIDASSSKKQNYEFYRQLGLAPEIPFLPLTKGKSPKGDGVHFKDSPLRHSEYLITPPLGKGRKEALENYLKNIRNIKLFFNGKKKQILKDLKKEMKVLAKEKRFEEAARVRNQIFALEHINDVALIKDDFLKTLEARPKEFRIEAYDVAHMSGKNMVGVMTVVENGQAQKSDYRKFIIRSQTGSNDTGALAEMLDRRLSHPEWRYPNLIVVDGSTAQINAAEKVLARAGVSIPIVSVVKDDRHRAKAIKGHSALASSNESAILLANSEAHRFAITFHKAKRARNFLK